MDAGLAAVAVGALGAIAGTFLMGAGGGLLLGIATFAAAVALQNERRVTNLERRLEAEEDAEE